MLDEQPDIDAVIIATPDHSHAVIAMAAMERKKHVYVQKPLTHSVYEARLLTETARKHGVATQMGNQGHSGEGARIICEWVWDGAIGRSTRRTPGPTGRCGFGHRGGPAQGHARVPKDLDWDLWIGPARSRPYHPPTTRRSGARGGTSDRLAGRHGLPHRGPALLGPEAQVSGRRGGQHLEVLARFLRADGAEERDVPRSTIVRFRFPAREKMPRST